MTNYVAGKDYKSRTERMFNPSESESMSKKTVVEKVIKKLHGSHRRRQLEKAFRKLSIEEMITQLDASKSEYTEQLNRLAEAGYEFDNSQTPESVGE